MGERTSPVKEDVLQLLEEFKEELNSVETEENFAFTDEEWLSHLELKFFLRAQRVRLLRSFVKGFESLHKPSSRARLKEALSFVQELLEKIEIKSQNRILATEPGSIPIVLSLAQRYKLSANETDLFQLLFVRGASKSTLVRTSTAAIIGGKDDKEMVINLCGMSFMDLQDFLHDKRTHISEGIIIQDDYDGKLIMSNDAISALLLRPLKTEQRLKLNKTELLNILESRKDTSIRELHAKLKFVQSRHEERIKLTEEAFKHGYTELPRLEVLATKLGLDTFEKGVILMLTAVSISPVVKSIFQGDAGDGLYYSSKCLQVKDFLSIFFESFKEQVLARTHFHKSSILVSRGMIRLRAVNYTRGSGDLMDQQVDLDRRILDWIVGLDTEIDELIEGSHLYKPKVSMQQVVLPDEQKEMLLRNIDNFSKFKSFRKEVGLEDVITYGAGLVILLCGPSGTGKTMTVDAVAHHLGKRVLLVDFHSLESVFGGSKHDDHSVDLRGLFRDVDMNDAIIFFDECEALFKKRERGGDKLFNALLTEMERHEGIIMLATNRPLDLDEAMHRRITCVIEFYAPDHTQRHKIWKLASERLPVEEDIDWMKISLRYELTGGYIKNALVSSLLMAISRDSNNPRITEDDIISGCRLQMRSSLQMKSLKQRIVPKTSMDELVLSTTLHERLNAIVEFEKARAVLLGQWGFQQERLGATCFFWGPHGAGKSSAAEAIGYELGRPLKVINCAQLVLKENSSNTSSNVRSAFKDARLMDAILVFDDFQILSSETGSSKGNSNSISEWSNGVIGSLLHELGSFPSMCILIANIKQGSTIVRLDHELLRRLKFVVEFKMPNAIMRSQMWKKMIPKETPLAEDINFEDLGHRFEFTSGSINMAIIRAAAKAALRDNKSFCITMKDMVKAAESEQEHMNDEVTEIMKRAFL
ncbi:cell division control protein 48 isoform X3 [Cryptomeria japonica]|uniref:cell division control protein 48 isoform X3 n=1 Tax=Cryptomeria japonica TaxID=3369 RepID=UPI0027DA758C|nr:cell division control protein 48 isoform X3 [Cryptomeria japonica]